MPRVLLTVQYRGTRYAGWQRQENATAVQQILEEALGSMFGQRIRIEGAGRTDSGVHAQAQRAHADLPSAISDRGLMLGVNNLLPPDIRITDCRHVPSTFHCRFDAEAKTYLYRILTGPVADAFLSETHAHVPHPLDARAMSAAAHFALGRHDFKSFTVLRPEVSSTWRTIQAIGVTESEKGLEIEVRADGFLRYMVRRIVGLLIETGRGKVPPTAMAAALEPQYQKVRWTAPAAGLTLVEIHYVSLPEPPESLC